ncbi:MarR family transcriptional regulator [uncultured Nocardioides sp.]|uniref:MarR family winged helix-turn-helix transcriptional regulator n=1 Tax=uncultured Nocardioides sp. TaxID=198441 RepID=UPI002610849C|nr:MarR family transcriptional regulator [uncultured Nocardioides sp.]HRD60122.1 MarR family transcriptional regulator [Nocardioides sp.]
MDAEELTEAGRRLNSFAIHLLRAMHRVDAQSGLTPARLSALSVLHFGGPRTLGRLARDEEVTSATMSRLVDALCDLGLAERGPHPDHGGMVVVSATEAGSVVMRAAAQRRIGVIAGALGDLPARERGAVVRATEQLGRLEQRVRDRVAGASSSHASR